MSICTTVAFFVLLFPGRMFAQSIPASPDRPSHFAGEQEIEDSAKQLIAPRFSIESDRTYTLAELVNLAEEHNPETRVAWEMARARIAALGVARSELYPTVAAVALSQTNRSEVLLASQFYRQTVQSFGGALALNYTIFDFGGRSSRIAAARADLFAANFAFNDTHRQIIYEVTEAYDRLLNATGQVEAARASLKNAQAVEQATEDRLKNGVATLPDVLEARSAAAQAQYDLQAALGIEKNTRGDLATALGTRPTDVIRVQPIDQLVIPESIGDSVDQTMDRAFEQRPDLMQQVAEVRKANAGVKEARAAYYPALSVSATPNAQSLYGLQQQLPWAHTADLTGELQLKLNWTLLTEEHGEIIWHRRKLTCAQLKQERTLPKTTLRTKSGKPIPIWRPRLANGKLLPLFSPRPINRIPQRWNPTTMVSATCSMLQRPRLRLPGLARLMCWRVHKFSPVWQIWSSRPET